MSGQIPRELGNLSSIQKLFLNSNNFTGELPETLGKLTALKDFRITDNMFRGKIPDFIRNWTNLEKLTIQASGLEGPIPPAIAFLTNLTDLRISDLYGPASTFPPLHNMKRLRFLTLRSCNITGQLPAYLGDMTNLTILDLSFNKLSGQIPSSFLYLHNTSYIYLTGNLLSGLVPEWMLEARTNIDLSYNNLTLNSSRGLTCQSGMLNLFGCSSKNSASGIVSCLQSSGFVCPQNKSTLYINCGGHNLTVDGNTYEDDLEQGGPSKFAMSKTKNWAFSSTGHFLDTTQRSYSYTSTSLTRVSGGTSDLYIDARISPLSLTYYGLCLVNGNYTVKLHFAEITFSDDTKYSSLGRRIFDVYIQGELVLQDFNIEDAAGVALKETIQNFTAIVNHNTLEIRLYWAGKGTTYIPTYGVYGPLISAISVENNKFLQSMENESPPKKGSSMSVGMLVGAGVAVVFAILLLLGIFWWRRCLQCKDSMETDLKGLDLSTGSFTIRQIKSATNNFDAANKIGEGGFGSVYKGLLSDGTIIAVKQLSSKSKQGNREFVNEIGMISALQHPHLVKLHGCCIEDNQLLLVYEYMENNSLARSLFGSKEPLLKLDWPTRHKICIGIARGLVYLHEESRLKIVHRDIKATNVLLDKDLNPKISDFGLAKLDEEENTHISTRIAGTYGYMAPEYALRGYLTDKADVYSYGVVTLEIISGMANTMDRTKENSFVLLDWAHRLKEKGDLMGLVDPKLGLEYNEEEVMLVINVGLLCTNHLPADRPTMSSVVNMLEGRTVIPEFVSISRGSNNKMKPTEEMQNQEQYSTVTSTSESQVNGTSREWPWTGSSTSTADDLYPPIVDSQYGGKMDTEGVRALLR